MAALLVGAGAPAALAQCAISPGTNQSSASNSAAINCINITGITVTGNVTNTAAGSLTPTGGSRPTRTGISRVASKCESTGKQRLGRVSLRLPRRGCLALDEPVHRAPKSDIIGPGLFKGGFCGFALRSLALHFQV
jgi:hypothetical protein